LTTIQVSDETKRRLVELAAKLQLELKRKVSLDETVRQLVAERGMSTRRSDLFDDFYGCLRRERVEEAYRLLKEARKLDEQKLARLERARSP